MTSNSPRAHAATHEQESSQTSSTRAARRASFAGSLGRRKSVAFVACGLLALVVFPACQSRTGKDAAATSGVVIVNSPATGEVRRVLVREGMNLEEGGAVVEIAVAVEGAQQPSLAPTEDPQARAGRNIQAAQTGIEAARAEVVRTEVEVQRLTPLAASGEVPQGQLDGARADYERAQQRFQQAQAAAQNAQGQLVATRQQARNNSAAGATAPPAPAERLVYARATSAGTVSAVSAREGARVTTGQPLATLRADPR